MNRIFFSELRGPQSCFRMILSRHIKSTSWKRAKHPLDIVFLKPPAHSGHSSGYVESKYEDFAPPSFTSTLQRSSRFVVCDAGGSTVDISAYEIKSMLSNRTNLEQLGVSRCMSSHHRLVVDQLFVETPSQVWELEGLPSTKHYANIL